MKKTLGAFFEEISEKSNSKRFLDSEIEMVSDETAQQLRGGDKDWLQLKKRQKFPTTSIDFFSLYKITCE